MVKKITQTKINEWIGGYQYLTLLYFLAKAKSLGVIKNKNIIDPLSIALELNIDIEVILRIFLALESVGMCSTKNKKIVLTKEGVNFLKQDLYSLRLKTILSFERWLPSFLGAIKLFNQVKNKKNGDIENTLQQWFAAESKIQAKYIVPKLPLKNIKTVADLGGGDGSLLVQILKSNKNIVGSLYDKFVANKNYISRSKRLNIRKRLTRYKFDFFKKFKINSEIIILKSVLHNWNDTNAIKILKNVYSATPQNSKLFIIERVYDKHNMLKKREIAFLDLRMLFFQSGKERSLNEFKRLFRVTGFEFENKIKTDSDFYVLTAKKISRTKI
jgi:predicted transcriptional regulator